MITEDYISFETAKVLKDKGFDEDCRAFYKEWDGEITLCPCTPSHLFEYCHNSMLEQYNDDEELNIAAPTIQMVMKWLRQTYKLQVIIYPFDCEDGIFWAYKIFSIEQECLEVNRSDTRVGYNSYEQSYEAAIKYCLKNLI